MKKSWLLALIVSTALMGSALAGALDDIKARGKLIVAVAQDVPPYGSIGPDMQPVGLDIDIARYVANKLKVPLEMVPVSGANRIPYLNTGKVDVIIACLGKNAEREKVIDFSHGYVNDDDAVFGPPDMAVSKPADLNGHTIGTSRGGTEDVELTAIAPPGADIQRFEDLASTLAAYASGQVDLVATEVSTAGEVNKTGGRRLVKKIVLDSEPTYIGMRKGDPAWTKYIDDTIAEMSANGKMAELTSKWLGDPTAADAAK